MSADGRGSAAIFATIGGGISSRRPRGDTLFRRDVWTTITQCTSDFPGQALLYSSNPECCYYRLTCGRSRDHVHAPGTEAAAVGFTGHHTLPHPVQRCVLIYVAHTSTVVPYNVSYRPCTNDFSVPRTRTEFTESGERAL